MIRKEYFDKINTYFAILSTKVKQSNSLNLTDESNFSEDFYRDLLNLCLGYNLINLNSIEQNATAIDLVDLSSNLSIQVTSTNSLGKIRDTVDKFIKNENHFKYDRLIILLLVEKKKYQAKNICDEKIFKFNIRRDVWDVNDFLRKIKDKKTEELKKIVSFFDKELPYYFKRKSETVSNFKGATFNNCQIHGGEGTQHNNMNNESSNNAEELLNNKMYPDAKNEFRDLMKKQPRNEDYKTKFIVSSLSNKKIIDEMNDREINYLYEVLGNLEEKRAFYDYLWLVIFYEYSNRHSTPTRLENQVSNKIDIINSYQLTDDEKKLTSDIKLYSKEANDYLP